MTVTLIDNYDSFTWNLVHLLAELGVDCRVLRNDAVTVAAVLGDAPDAIITSPGPCTPNEAGICLELTRAAGAAGVPLLGVCLGHQTIGQAFGGKVVRAPTLMHGKLSPIRHGGAGIFRALPTPFPGTRYHSLIVERATLPEELAVTAETDDGLIMGLQHRDLPIHGVQFHPESIASACGHDLLANFLGLAGVAIAPLRPGLLAGGVAGAAAGRS